MKKYLSLALLLFSGLSQQTAFSQTRPIDSLLAELKSSRPDTQRVSILSKLIAAHEQEGDAKTAVVYGEQALGLAQQLKEIKR